MQQLYQLFLLLLLVLGATWTLYFAITFSF